MRQSWPCEACGATAANPWPQHPVEGRAKSTEAETHDELRPVTALFADVVGSTSLGEQLGPAEIKALIGECVTRMTRAVEGYGGTVGSYMGDGIAAFFGLKGAREDDAIRAGLAALRVLDVISDYAHEIEAAWDIPSVAVRVGVNSGRVATGIVGEANPQHVALGDAINVAARLQAQASPGSIVVGAGTAGQLASRFSLERIGQVEIRGRRQRVEAWKLVRYLGKSANDHASGFVGRDRELEAFERAVEGLRLGRGRIVVVSGDAGIGKSRLVSECRVRAQAELHWLSGGCAHQQVPRPYGPFVEILSQWLEIEPDTPQVVSRVRLLARLRESLGDDASAVLPFLCQLLAVAETDEPAEIAAIANEHRVAALRRAYASWIAALSQQKPVVLAIDEVDRADASTEALLEELFELADSIPLLVVLAMRDDPGTPGWAARVDALANHPRRTLELRLEPLAEIEAEEFIALKDSRGVIAPAIRCELRTRAEGNPLYLEELTRSALEALETPNEQGPFGGRDELRLPAALEGLLLARIDRVAARARSVLHLASIAGRRFPKSILEAATSRLGLDEALGHLVREGILEADGLVPTRYFAFRHGLYQEAVIGTLTTNRRRELHEAVARALEAATPGQALEEIASHYAASGNDLKAIEYLEKAGRRAASLSSLGTAVEFIERARTLALSCGDERSLARLASFAAELERHLGRYAEASALWREVLRLASDDSAKAQVYLEIARTEFELGDLEAAATVCDRGLTLRGNSERRDLLLTMAAIDLRRDLFNEARTLLEEVDAVPGAAPMRTEVQRLSLWAGYHAHTGALAEAEKYGAETVRAAELSGDVGLQLRAKRDAGLIQFARGRLDLARASLEDVYRSALDTGQMIRAQEAVGNLLGAYLMLGTLKEGLELGLEALEWVTARSWRVLLLRNVAEIEYELGSDTARSRLVECETLCNGEQAPRGTGAFATLRLALMKLDEGDGREAEAIALRIAGEYFDGRRDDVLVEALTTLATVAMSTGQPELALDHAKRAQALTERADRTMVPPILRVTARALASIGQHTDALKVARRTLDMAQSMSMRLEEARALLVLGALDEADCRHHFHRAREIFAECGSERGLTEVRRALAAS